MADKLDLARGRGQRSPLLYVGPNAADAALHSGLPPQ